MVASLYFIVGFSSFMSFPPKLFASSCLVSDNKWFPNTSRLHIFSSIRHLSCPLLIPHILCGSLHLHASTMAFNFWLTCHDSFFKDETFSVLICAEDGFPGDELFPHPIRWLWVTISISYPFFIFFLLDASHRFFRFRPTASHIFPIVPFRQLRFDFDFLSPHVAASDRQMEKRSRITKVHPSSNKQFEVWFFFQMDASQVDYWFYFFTFASTNFIFVQHTYKLFITFLGTASDSFMYFDLGRM